jgi:hypothetical protein
VTTSTEDRLKMPVRFTSLASLLLSLPLFAACGYGDHEHRGYYDNGNGYVAPSPQSTTIEQATIDTDQALDVMPGQGAGTFIEYDSGGTYHVTTSCDSVNGNSCSWDLLLTPLDGAPVTGVAPVDLESDDSVSVGSGNQVHFIAHTSSDFDGITLQTTPGAGIELDALLDNGDANRYLFWVGDGALHSGAPSNPIDLVPSAK